MAENVVQLPLPSTLQLVVDIGGDTQRTRSYRNVKHNVNPVDLYNLGEAMGSLMKDNLEEIYKVDRIQLIEDEE
ncbi:MAG: hypothetical protein D5R97_00035 [Candidatus Syntrophonatronum acetioxidans]|uniref:DUF1659 domain-containing protein n=1 Tax=Candidatus Syntrophonatronum acetioxidans TaxID=1795816 RepID=A0A424YJC8_9FIRM|nr:MAG: hypothetical protein D5R97_00035 [Candidatus Syntrophonatronum acetioxidans]